MARIKPYIRIRYTGPGVSLGIYGRIESGEIFSMKRRDWEYLEDSADGVPETFQKVGEAEDNLPKETPAKVEDLGVVEEIGKVDGGTLYKQENGEEFIAENEAIVGAPQGVEVETNPDTPAEDQKEAEGQTEAPTAKENKIPQSRKRKGGK